MYTIRARDISLHYMSLSLKAMRSSLLFTCHVDVPSTGIQATHHPPWCGASFGNQSLKDADAWRTLRKSCHEDLNGQKLM